MVHRTVIVPALGSAAVDPSTGLATGQQRLARSPLPVEAWWPTRWCPDPWAGARRRARARTATQWAFAGGSTTAGNSLTLALFNPAAPASVVNISFLTKTGLVTPQAYQGLVIPPGRLVVENIGAYVQRASGHRHLRHRPGRGPGELRVPADLAGRGGGMSLRLGSPGLSTVWRFAQTTAELGCGGGLPSGQSEHPARCRATIAPGLSSGTVIPRRVSVPPLSIVDFSASGTAGLPHQTPYSLTIDSSGPIVVGRSVSAGGRAPPPAWGSSAGTVTVATRWLIPGPGASTRGPGTADVAIKSLAVADPVRPRPG